MNQYQKAAYLALIDTATDRDDVDIVIMAAAALSGNKESIDYCKGLLMCEVHKPSVPVYECTSCIKSVNEDVLQRFSNELTNEPELARAIKQVRRIK